MTGKQKWNLAKETIENNNVLLCEIYKSLKTNNSLLDHIDLLKDIFSDFNIIFASEDPFTLILDIGNSAPDMKISIYTEDNHIKIRAERIKN